MPANRLLDAATCARARLGAGCAGVALTGLLLTACGTAVSMPTEACGLIADASTSAAELLPRSRPAITQFVDDNRCRTVQLVAISANSVGESCTARRLDLVDTMRADPSNQEAWQREFESKQVPQLNRAVQQLAACVGKTGTAEGTDVFGALVELDRLSTDADPGGPAHRVLLVSDLANTVGVDLTAVPLRTPEERAAVIAEVDRAGLLPDLDGWEVIAAGAAFATTELGPERSAQLQQFWQELVEARGATWTMLAI